MNGRKFPWNGFKKRISKMFMNEYNGSKKVALPAEEWVELHNLAKKNHPWLVKLDDCLLSIEVKWERIMEFFNYPRLYYVNAIRDKTHTLPTGLEKGKWHDMSYRMFHGLMEGVVWYAENEANEDIKYYLELKEKDDLGDYPDHQKECMETIIEVKNWYQVTLKKHEQMIDDCYERLPNTTKNGDSIMTMFSNKNPEETIIRNKIFKQIHDIEGIIEKDKIKYMKKIVDIHGGMWS